MKKSPEKILIHQQTDSINKIIDDVNEMLPYFKGIVEEFQKLGLGGITNYQELFKLYQDPEKFWKQKAYANIQVPEIEGPFEIDKEAYVKGQGIKFRDNTKLLAAVAETRRIAPHKLSSIEYYTIEEGQVIVNKNSLQELVDNKTVYASTPEEIALVEALDALSKDFDKVNKLYKKATGRSPFWHKAAADSSNREFKNNFVLVKQEIIPGSNNRGYGISEVSPNYELVVKMKKELIKTS